jgi:hypothetical protein
MVETVGTTTAGQAEKSPAELALELYNLLSSHPSDTRKKAMQAAMTLLGETPVPQQGGARAGQTSENFGDLKIGPKALKWIEKHGITRVMLEEVFHVTGGDMDIIAGSVPGSSKREMTINCYLLTGARGLLKTDSPCIDDSDAIGACKRLTAYDKNNHTANRLAMGNRMNGTRPTFTLTGPGETAAGDLIKRMGNS